MESNESDLAEPLTPEIVDPEDDAQAPTQPSVSEPSKLIRIASMTRAMLDEVREAALDDAGRKRLVSIYQRSLDELKDVLSDDLVDELDAVFVPITDRPSEAELRVAQAQLVGWLEGLFHGIQASLITQQMAATAQLDRMRQRKALEQQASAGDGNGVYL
ncbi:MAG TPA: proteasome activator [Acidimicrobiia bacterium]|nr:proteasome activator [Acidimicrobiia bacterium]